ncbi:MAG TPA: trigger factor [Steroidobacteraceae bacterium]|nr:trigger factor [Steroidobacteraceae bacterium]
MQVSVTTTTGLERRLEVAVPGERLAGEVDERLKRLTRTARIRGFRPGKVPYAVVKQQFGSQVHAEAVSDLMQKTFAEAVTQHKLRPVGGPRIEPIQIEPGSELRYAAVFEVLPEISLKPLDAVQIERATASISEQDVDAMLERMRTQRPVYAAVTRAAADGDRVTLDHEGRIDGSVFAGGKGTGLRVTIGTHQILPELEQALIGMSAADTKTVAARFPDDYGAKAVAGKQAEFDLAVTAVEQPTPPALDDEFAKGFGADGLEGLRVEVRKSMERELAEAVRGKLHDRVTDVLYRDNPLELPRTMIDEQISDLQAQMLRRLGSTDPQQLPAREVFEQNARRRVALGLLLGEIVRSQQLKVDRARVEERLDIAVANSPDPQELRRQYLASREAMQQLESAALEDQAIDWVLSQVKIVERASSFAEMTGFGQRG